MRNRLRKTELPEEIRRYFRSSARNLLGNGYVDDYYDSAASEFYWAYWEGIRVGRKQVARERKAKKGRTAR